MATDTKELILGWCSAADDLQLAGERSEPDTEYVLTLTSEGAEITATLPDGGDRLLLAHRVDLGESSPAVEGDLPFIEEQRPGPVRVSLAEDGVRISTWIVLDGLTKHSLLTAVSDLTRTRRAVLRLLGAPARPALSGRAATDEAGADTPAAGGAEGAEPSGGVWPAAASVSAAGESGGETVPEATPGAAAWPGLAAGTAGQAGAGYAAEQAAAAQPWESARPASEGAAAAQGYAQPYSGAVQPAPVPAGPAAWTPGHKVPPQGMQAWAAPDPNGPVIATLGGHLPVQVTEMRGAWAHVVCSNGWTGWVDGRLLVAGP